MHPSLPVVLTLGFTWATVTALRVAGAFALGAYRGVTKRREPTAITSLIFGPPFTANLAVAAAVTTVVWPIFPP